MFFASALFAAALVPCEVVYTTRAQYAPDHHNTATLFEPGEINTASYRTEGALKAWNPDSGLTRVIVPAKKGRTIRDPEVSPDGKTILFSMRNNRNDFYHLYTVSPDGADLRQLTFGRTGSDIDPAFLPDGRIVFSSTRDRKYCMCNRHIMANLWRCEADGSNPVQLGFSTLFEGHSSVLPDGRILYDRWEYVDRNFGDAQGLWTCNPDGTQHAVWYGNNTTSPGGVINARPVGDGSRVIAVMTACHDRPWGALALIDRTKGVDGPDPVVRTWPETFRLRVHEDGEDFDSPLGVSPRYADPCPIDENHFLCVRQRTPASEETAVYCVDTEGHEEFLFADAPGCHSPVLLRPSPARPVIPDRVDHASEAPGFFYVQNVYEGTHMKGVEKGSVKSLRIVESPAKRHWTGPRGWFGHGEMAPAMNWHSFENKRILGTVPVEEDGSAYFEVPKGTFVYFQALDAKGMMVQSMRSGTYVQPGEKYGCIGCHETRVGEGPKASAVQPLALRRAPSKPEGWYGPSRLFSFRKEVQPVFDAHCVSCHDYGKKAGAKLNLAGDRGAYFSTAYTDLYAGGWVNLVGGGPAEIRPAKSWGACVSKLTKTLYGHAKTKLTDEERDRVITWMDINGPYHEDYAAEFPDHPGGRMPITTAERDALQSLCGKRIEDSFRAHQREMLDFDRPECSRILEGVQEPNRTKALEILIIGRKRLVEN